MAFIEDPGRVAETTNTTGSGAITVLGAVVGYQRFSAKLSVNDTFPGGIVASDGTWQEGIFTYSAANQITFTTVLDGSSGTTPITLPAGTHTVFAGFLGMGKTITNAPGKTTPTGADLLALVDSADSNRLKSLSLTNLSTYLAGGAWTTYTPTVASSSGTITTLGTVSGRYKQIGKTVYLYVSITITTNGTGASAVTCSLPGGMTFVADDAPVSGSEQAVFGTALKSFSVSGGSIFSIALYNNTYPGADGAKLVVRGVFEIA